MTDLDIRVENIQEEIELELVMDVSELELELDSSGYIPETYDGPYEVTPDFEDQVLETEDLLMSDDVIVKEIPVAEVTNPAGGLTLTIGS